ncbi:hypothetical protein Ais01nite_04320 [Asanoa ishikariensis]|nr:hypothetical protein Ais01nite_04320 [Asanoa ishikariensis]
MDERVHAALVDLAEEVRPAPDPYGRLRARRSRVRRRRTALGGAALALIAAVATTLPLLPDRGGSAVNDTDPGRSIHEWSERLRLSPIRGAFGAANPDYVEELARLVLERQRTGVLRVKEPVTEVNVLYLDDVDHARVAFVAFHRATPDPRTSWENASAWLIAKPGASAAELADLRPYAIGDGLGPVETISNFENEDGSAKADVALAIAPTGCVVESAPLPAVDKWTPEPTVSYVVRTRATERAEWWRVVCDGVVKEVRPATVLYPRATLSEKQLDAALRGAGGTVDRAMARKAVQSAGDLNFNMTIGPSRVVWGGEIAGSQPDASGSFDGHAVITVTPWIRDSWCVNIEIEYAAKQPDSTVGRGVQQVAPADPSGPNAALPIRLGEGASVLVIVPAGATSVRALRAGAVIDTAEVTGQAAVVDARDAPDLTFEALDRDGTVLTSATIPVERPLDLVAGVVPW